MDVGASGEVPGVIESREQRTQRQIPTKCLTDAVYSQEGLFPLTTPPECLEIVDHKEDCQWDGHPQIQCLALLLLERIRISKSLARVNLRG